MGKKMKTEPTEAFHNLPELTELPKWVISDTHWHHTNINKYSARCTPMHPTPEAVDQLMITNWHGLVKPEDTILHLGDIGFFKKDADTSFLKDLPGKKFIVRGNHDDRLSAEWFAEHGFTEVKSPSIEVEGKEVIFTHYPQSDLRWNQVNVHGHQHNSPSNSTSKHLNVCVELWHYAPVDCEFVVDNLFRVNETNVNDLGPRNVYH